MRTLVITLVSLIGMSLPSAAADLQTQPPTGTLNGSTAYTLRQNEWQIGSISLHFRFPNPGLLFRLSQIQWLNVEYGLTPRLQIGNTVLENVLEGPNIWGKLN